MSPFFSSHSPFHFLSNLTEIIVVQCWMTQWKPAGEGRLMRANVHHNYLPAFTQLQTMSLCTPSITALVIMQIGPCERNTSLSTFPLAHLPHSGNECIRGEFQTERNYSFLITGMEPFTHNGRLRSRRRKSIRHIFNFLNL